jgi:hypothetical protein
VKTCHLIQHSNGRLRRQRAAYPLHHLVREPNLIQEGFFLRLSHFIL